MRILTTDFNESLEWTEEAMLTILERANPNERKTELLKHIRKSGLCKTTTKSKKRKNNPGADARDVNSL